jgi:hypothetical protein
MSFREELKRRNVFKVGAVIIVAWHGGLPAISLVAFAFFAAGYVINLFGRE